MINGNAKMDDDIVTQERNYFLQVLKTFDNYKKQSLLRIEYKEKCLSALPSQHQTWLEKYKNDLDNIKSCIDKNADYIPIVVQHAKNIFENLYTSDNSGSHQKSSVGTLSEGLDKVQSVFKQLMRDWSSLGAKEREECYSPVINEIELQFPEDKVDRRDIEILVPGAGLGRLAFEIAKRKFNCQGNEFNMFMLIVSFHVLNHCKKIDEFEVFPWIHQYCNNLSVETQMLSVRFPDIITSLDKSSQFSMTAGDFLEVYTEPDVFDCVATCFFIDCASNIVEFLETIYTILKPNGVWINLGPLLYHYSYMKNEKSIEPSFEVLCEVIKKVGFVMEKCQTGLKTRYCQNPQAMLQYEYDSVFFVCRKPMLNGNHFMGDLQNEIADAFNGDKKWD
ncbi:carnosine N-methyltransferase [Onthophagus taurus]|uniref:carnosine N-methyltransferase n=1 Tax=Onthophagus taurus TaxID=166361 RepID=UPI000C20B03F|nr:carnosine N-methyltransferase [Onthophagus taurus]